MARKEPTKAERKKAARLIKSFDENRYLVAGFLKQFLGHLEESQSLTDHMHSIRPRIKDRDHLEDKLYRIMQKCKGGGEKFEITPDNLLVRINDLAGIRILHLYTKQVEKIDSALRKIFEEQNFKLIEGPFARTWDDEYRGFFRSLNFETQDSETMYTSVHYVIESGSNIPVTCEIQVRTLMEEVWGEVDHMINYPHPMDSVACSEQIKTLARVTSSATRLVDSIFATVSEVEELTKAKSNKTGPARKKHKIKKRK